MSELNYSSYSFGVVTVSDSCFKGENVDKSGPEIQRLLRQSKATKISQSTVPDDLEEIVVRK